MDFTTHAAASQLLLNIGKVLSHSEYAQLRLVCHTWNAVITNTGKFNGKRITFSKKNWTKEASASVPYHNLVTTWQAVTIKHASLITDKIFMNFWKIACKNIVNLQLNNLQVRCSDVTQFLFHHCPHAQHVTLDMIHYQISKCETEDGEFLVLCDHQSLEEVGCRPTPNARTTITSIRMTSCLIVPNCILDTLKTKSAGHLFSFSYEGAKMTPTRTLYFPAEATVSSKLVDLVRASQKSLKYLKWVNNINGHEIFNQLSALVEQRPALTEPELKIDKLLFEGYSQPDFAGIIPADEAVFRFIRLQSPYLKILQLIQGSSALPLRTLPGLLPVLAGLDTLVIALKDADDRVVMNLNNIASLANLKFFKIDVRQRFRVPVLSSSYVSFIPNDHLQGLCLGHPTLTNGHVLQAIARLNPPQVQASNLVSFVLAPASEFCDRDMQTLIKSLPRLKNLVLKPCTRLTDSGITGLNWETVLELRRNKTYQFLRNDDVFESESGNENSNAPDDCYNLRQLQELETLSLCGGPKISDVSVFASFCFPKLRHLQISGSKVTDVSLVHIAKNCPKLRILKLKGESRCTFHGLNAMLAVGKKITTIFVQLKTANRLLDRRVLDKYYVHPDFKKVVTTLSLTSPLD